MICRCGCGLSFAESRTTRWRLSRGEDVGYLPGHGARGDRNPNWKGGTINTSNGYRMVLKPNHPNAMKNGYVLEHRLVAAEAMGRPLRDGEVVHHRNRNRGDNKRGNLTPMMERPHKSGHWKGAQNPRWIGGPQPKPCATCGVLFVGSHGNHKRAKFCSQACRNAPGPQHPRRKK